MPRFSRSTDGFTYLAALFMVVIIGIMLGAVGQSMQVIMNREKEKELIFRGLQYRDAIERWNDPKKNRGPLKALKDLFELTVSSSANKSEDRLLRKLYKDPITGGEWKPWPNPPNATQGITGVVSSSNEEPYKKDFPEALKSFNGKKKYSEWIFKYEKPSKAGAGAQPAQQLSMPLSIPESQ